MFKRVKRIIAILLITLMISCVCKIISLTEAATEVEFVKTAGGGSATLAIDSSGNLWSWGSKSGNGTTTDLYTPEKITTGTIFKEIACGSVKIAIDSSGNLWAWGNNLNGQLGNGTTTDSDTPQKTVTSTKFSKVTADSTNVAAIDTSGNIWVWGGVKFNVRNM